MNILFPGFDRNTKTLYPDVAEQSPVANPVPIYLSDLVYWQDSLAALWNEFQSPPPSVRQLFYDRRNPLQWYTFWFAFAIFVLTVVFGIISSVLTGIQTGYAHEALQLAREGAVLAREAAVLAREEAARSKQS